MNDVTPDAAAASTWQEVDPDAAAGRPMIPFNPSVPRQNADRRGRCAMKFDSVPTVANSAPARFDI
ncbi:MAG TPA: hypothetical protein PLX84_11410 [Acidiphilium sp.]|nr:hypothetical protein [Acidiphilium sp.]